MDIVVENEVQNILFKHPAQRYLALCLVFPR